MSLNARILLSFAVMAALVAAISILGLSGYRASNLSLQEVVSLDLPAEETLGRIGRYFEAAVAEQNFLLNQNLDMKEHQGGHARYVEARAGLMTAIANFDREIRQIAGGDSPEPREFMVAWTALKLALEEWVKINDQVFDL